MASPQHQSHPLHYSVFLLASLNRSQPNQKQWTHSSLSHPSSLRKTPKSQPMPKMAMVIPEATASSHKPPLHKP
ncbi:hypothetical protein FRC02_012081 [Tulasnella sp. 418]|nr:hypothetical protein FRC02_012081 [Tulasnella sp. 418]